MSVRLEEVIDQAKNHRKLIIADDYELTVQSAVSQVKKFRNGQEMFHSLDDNLWLNLRVLHQRRPGRASTYFKGGDSIQQLVDNAFESAKRANPDPWFRFPLWKSTREQTEPLLPALEGVESLHPQLRWTPDVVEEVFEDWQIETSLVRKTEKARLSYRKAAQGVHFSVQNHFGDQYFWLREERAYSRGIDFEERAECLGQLLNRSFKRKGGVFFSPTGRKDILMSPRAVAPLLKKMLQWFCADEVQGGRSPLIAHRGKMLFSPELTLIDQGNLPGGLFSAPFDLEGSVTQRTVLVERGLHRDFLYDCYAATKENRLSTGNFHRVGQEPRASLGPSNIYFAPDESASESGQGLTDGIWLEELEKVEALPSKPTEFIISGMGWLVEAGERVAPIWQIKMRIDLLRLFQQAVSVGNDLIFYGCVGSPSILFEKIPLEV